MCKLYGSLSVKEMTIYKVVYVVTINKKERYVSYYSNMVIRKGNVKDCKFIPDPFRISVPISYFYLTTNPNTNRIVYDRSMIGYTCGYENLKLCYHKFNMESTMRILEIKIGGKIMKGKESFSIDPIYAGTRIISYKEIPLEKSNN